MLGPRKLARWVRNRFIGSPIILLYHRIASITPDPWDLCVTPEHFAEQLSVLKNEMHPQPLHQLIDPPRGQVSRRLVGVTFDDGYADNLSIAKPLLEQFGIPATVFVVSGHVGGQREFWWDELEKILLQPGKLPEVLCLTIRGKCYVWEIDDPTGYTPASCERSHSSRAIGHDDPGKRQFLYRALYELLQPLGTDERRDVVDTLFAWANVSPDPRPSHQSMTRDQLQKVEHDSLVEIGAHTVNHPVLSALPVALQQHEIEQSKNDLEEICGRPITKFAYPHGAPSHYTADTIAIVKRAGFLSACSAFGEFVQDDTDPFQMPRFAVPDLDGERFRQWLHALS
jgi:peptidoglycan/xylan/chitin deacetylase (PgdA/CDA1 family)